MSIPKSLRFTGRAPATSIESPFQRAWRGKVTSWVVPIIDS